MWGRVRRVGASFDLSVCWNSITSQLLWPSSLIFSRYVVFICESPQFQYEQDMLRNIKVLLLSPFWILLSIQSSAFVLSFCIMSLCQRVQGGWRQQRHFFTYLQSNAYAFYLMVLVLDYLYQLVINLDFMIFNRSSNKSCGTVLLSKQLHL